MHAARRRLAALSAGLVMGLGLMLVAKAEPRPAPTPRPRPARAQAAEAYATNCAGCHGEDGRGQGPIATSHHWRDIEGADLSRRPRDFTRDWFRYGDTRAAIIRTINYGVRDTAMQVYPKAYPPAVVAALADQVLRLRGQLRNDVIRRRFPDRIPKDVRQPGFHRRPDAEPRD